MWPLTISSVFLPYTIYQCVELENVSVQCCIKLTLDKNPPIHHLQISSSFSFTFYSEISDWKGDGNINISAFPIMTWGVWFVEFDISSCASDECSWCPSLGLASRDDDIPWVASPGCEDVREPGRGTDSDCSERERWLEPCRSVTDERSVTSSEFTSLNLS